VVIIPYYNGSGWIERAIKSVATQTVPADEFLIVNDGSKPDEREVLGRLAEKYSFKIIDKSNGGQGSARNVGVAASQSEYISFLDQDDFYLPDHIKNLTEFLPKDEPRLGYVYADLCEADLYGNIIHSNTLHRAGAHPIQGSILDVLRDDLFVLPSASLIYRPAFEKLGGFDEQFRGYEDDDLFLRMFRAGYIDYFLDKPVTVWCMHTGSTSWSITMSRSRFKYFKKLAHSYEDDPLRNLFYFRDCFVPRFGGQFTSDAIKAARFNKDRDELNGFLIEYSKMVYANKFVSWLYKAKLKLIVFLLTRCPHQITKRLNWITGHAIFRRFLGHVKKESKQSGSAA
jgi:glycosyltransferase involved in cell wall biosynthesis